MSDDDLYKGIFREAGRRSVNSAMRGPDRRSAKIPRRVVPVDRPGTDKRSKVLGRRRTDVQPIERRKSGSAWPKATEKLVLRDQPGSSVSGRRLGNRIGGRRVADTLDFKLNKDILHLEKFIKDIPKKPITQELSQSPPQPRLRTTTYGYGYSHGEKEYLPRNTQGAKSYLNKKAAKSTIGSSTSLLKKAGRLGKIAAAGIAAYGAYKAWKDK